MPRYFYTEQAATPVVSNGRSYSFTATGNDFGRLLGVLMADTQQAEADLLALIGRPGYSIQEISEADFLIEKKKQLTPALPVSSPSREVHSAPSAYQQQSIQERQGVLRADSPKPAAEEEIKDKKLPTRDELLKVEPITLLQPFISAEERIEAESATTA